MKSDPLHRFASKTVNIGEIEFNDGDKLPLCSYQVGYVEQVGLFAAEVLRLAAQKIKVRKIA